MEECLAETGRAPVGTKWIDVNKGTAENPNIRCRFVASQRLTKKEFCEGRWAHVRRRQKGSSERQVGSQ